MVKFYHKRLCAITVKRISLSLAENYLSNSSSFLVMPTENVLDKAKKDGVKFISLQIIDLLGVVKEVVIPINQFKDALADGVWFDGSSIEGFARIQESDMIAKPDPTTFQLVPWRICDRPVARMFCVILNPDGTSYEGDPRYVLKRLLKKVADKGYTFYLGPELEYFYFKDGKCTEILDDGGYFDSRPLDLGSDLRRDTIFALQSMGIDVE